MKLRLCMINVVPVEWVGKQDGLPVKKVKYVLISENNHVYVAWSDTDSLKDRVIGSDTYDDARAREYEAEPDEFDGKLKYRIKLA